MKYMSFDENNDMIGRFDSEFMGDNLPSGLTPISDELYFYSIEQSNGVWHKNDDGEIVLNPLKEPPPPTIEQLAEAARASRDKLLAVAAIRIAPLQDAIDLEESTKAEEALLKKWKQYRIALNRIEQQAGFPREIDWPVAPQ